MCCPGCRLAVPGWGGAGQGGAHASAGEPGAGPRPRASGRGGASLARQVASPSTSENGHNSSSPGWLYEGWKLCQEHARRCLRSGRCAEDSVTKCLGTPTSSLLGVGRGAEWGWGFTSRSGPSDGSIGASAWSQVWAPHTQFSGFSPEDLGVQGCAQLPPGPGVSTLPVLSPVTFFRTDFAMWCDSSFKSRDPGMAALVKSPSPRLHGLDPTLGDGWRGRLGRARCPAQGRRLRFS